MPSENEHQGQQEDQTPRRHRRLDVRIMAALREAGRHRFEVDVVDLSEGGCQVQTRYHLRTGTRIWLAFPGLSGIEAEVAWNRGAQYGCRFASPLHPAMFDHIAMRYGIRLPSEA